MALVGWSLTILVLFCTHTRAHHTHAHTHHTHHTHTSHTQRYILSHLVQVHQDFLLGRFTKLESKDNISAAFMMAALDLWKWALREGIDDTAAIL